jgi:hypothetical protein
MTRARVRAVQDNAPRTDARMSRATVTAIGTHTVSVQLPGATGSVAGVRVAGATYTVGGDAWVLIQEPAVGPVFPIA